jgi:hypothetical protein
MLSTPELNYINALLGLGSFIITLLIANRARCYVTKPRGSSKRQKPANAQ